MNPIHGLFALLLAFSCALAANADQKWITYQPPKGKANGKKIVMIAAGWEYRAEEGLTMLAKILSQKHGFTCTVLFAINKEDGTIDPNTADNIPGLEMLAEADMLVMLGMDARVARFTDENISSNTLNPGKPILAFRCTVLAFKNLEKRGSPYANYDLESSTGSGGFGGLVLGERWRGHHGHHAVESTRGVVNGRYRNHPILKGVAGDIWGPTDVYQIDYLPEDAVVLAYAQVLKGMKPDDPPNFHKPVMPMVWAWERAGGFWQIAGGHQHDRRFARFGERRFAADCRQWRLLVSGDGGQNSGKIGCRLCRSLRTVCFRPQQIPQRLEAGRLRARPGRRQETSRYRHSGTESRTEINALPDAQAMRENGAYGGGNRTLRIEREFADLCYNMAMISSSRPSSGNGPMTAASRFALPCLLLWLAIFSVTPATAEEAHDLTFFSQHVAPLLSAECLSCHGSEKKGELDLRSGSTARAGGASGQVIAPGVPEESLLFEYVASGEMPPEGKLSDEHIAIFRRWIEQGAAYPREPVDPLAYSSEKRAGYDWWSLQPLGPFNSETTSGLPARWRTGQTGQD